jgi:hypothetical protein
LKKLSGCLDKRTTAACCEYLRKAEQVSAIRPESGFRFKLSDLCGQAATKRSLKDFLLDYVLFA